MCCLFYLTFILPFFTHIANPNAVVKTQALTTITQWSLTSLGKTPVVICVIVCVHLLPAGPAEATAQSRPAGLECSRRGPIRSLADLSAAPGSRTRPWCTTPGPFLLQTAQDRSVTQEGGETTTQCLRGYKHHDIPPGPGDRSGCTSTCAPSPAPQCAHLGPHRGSPAPWGQPFSAAVLESAPTAHGRSHYGMSKHDPPKKHCRQHKTDGQKSFCETQMWSLREKLAMDHRNIRHINMMWKTRKKLCFFK